MKNAKWALIGLCVFVCCFFRRIIGWWFRERVMWEWQIEGVFCAVCLWFCVKAYAAHSSHLTQRCSTAENSESANINAIVFNNEWFYEQKMNERRFKQLFRIDINIQKKCVEVAFLFENLVFGSVRAAMTTTKSILCIQSSFHLLACLISMHV